MNRREFLKKSAAGAAALAVGGASSLEAPAVEEVSGPMLQAMAADPVLTTAVLNAFPDLLQTGIRQVFSDEYLDSRRFG